MVLKNTLESPLDCKEIKPVNPKGNQFQIFIGRTDAKATMETMTDFTFLGSKITMDVDCGHEIKRCLLLGRKIMTNLDNILKSKDIILPTKVCLVKAMVFPVVMYECES